LTIYGDGQQSRCFSDVDDVVEAMMIGLTDHPEALGKVFNVGSTEEVTILELAQSVLTLVSGSIEPRLLLVPYEEAYESGFEDMRRRVPDISKIKAATGWEPKIPLDETLRNIIRSLQPIKT
jgi:UDP-glucose 4-epimerase